MMSPSGKVRVLFITFITVKIISFFACVVRPKNDDVGKVVLFHVIPQDRGPT